MSKHVLLWLLFAALLFSCRNTEIKLDDVDLDAWMRDPGGCGGLRAAFAGPFRRPREELLRPDEAQVTLLWGEPDEHELYVRGQKVYRYYLGPSPVCANAVDNARSLVIRFNAVGLSSEVYLE